MKPRTLLILGLLALVMAGFIFFVERDLPSTDERRELDKKLIPVEAEQVSALVLRWPDHEIRLLKDQAGADGEDGGDAGGLQSSAAGWRLEAPISAGADGAEVAGLIDRLVNLEKGRTLEEIDEEQLGLGEPAASFELEADGQVYSVRIGTELPLSSDIVMARDDRPGTAFQVSGAVGLVGELTRELDAWRDKSLFVAERADIERISLGDGEGETLVLARRGEAETFWLETPIIDRAADQDVSALLTLIVGLEAAAFHDRDPDSIQLGFDAPTAQVLEVQVAGAEEPWRLELGHTLETLAATIQTGAQTDAVQTDAQAAAQAEERGRRWARLGDQLLEIDGASLEEPLARSADEWRSRAWSSMQVFKVDDAHFELGDQSLSIRRVSGEWLRTTDDAEDVKVDFTAASDALYPLTELRATDLLETDTAEAAGHLNGGPQLSITLIASDGVEERLELYTVQGDTAAATAAGRDAVLLLTAEDAQGVLEKVEALRAAEPYQPEEVDGDAVETAPANGT